MTAQSTGRSRAANSEPSGFALSGSFGSARAGSATNESQQGSLSLFASD